MSAGRQGPQCNEGEVFLRCDSDEHSSCWEKVSGFCWYSAAVHFLAGHLTAQWALKLEMMLLPLARRRRLPCHPAYAGRHKSYSVNKDPPHSTTAHSSRVLIFPVNVIPFSVVLLRPLIFLVCVSLSRFFSSETVVNTKLAHPEHPLSS